MFNKNLNEMAIDNVTFEGSIAATEKLLMMLVAAVRSPDVRKGINRIEDKERTAKVNKGF